MSGSTALTGDPLSNQMSNVSENTAEHTRPAEISEAGSYSGAINFFGWAGNLKSMMAFLFSSLFLLLSLVLVVASVFQFMNNVFDDSTDLISVAIKSINILVISLAMYELGVGVGKEYINCESGDNIFFNIRRTITRFVGTVCIAVVLEALIMIIKYSQLDMAGNLFYPVAIMLGSGVLLASLGVFLSMTRGHTE